MERNFVCNCGKSYLSYPALYTHIKTKHQGQAPSPGQIIAIPRTNEIKTAKDDIDTENQKNLSTPDEALVTIINTFRAYSPTKQLHYTIDDIFSSFPEEIRK